MTIIDKSNPFPAKIKERSLLNKSGSTKQTYHIVLDIKGSGLSFKPGDSIAVIPQNDALRVQEALRSRSMPTPKIPFLTRAAIKR